MLEEKIEFLSNLLNKYDIEYINSKYRAIEFGYTLESIKKAKYSDQMKKRILAEAKRKSISKSRKEYIQSLIG